MPLRSIKEDFYSSVSTNKIYMVTVGHELTKFHIANHRLYAGEHDDLWENNGWGIVGGSGAKSFLLWTSPYTVISRGKKFFNKDLSLFQILYFEGDEQKTIHDNDFISLGWDSNAHLNKTEIEVEVDSENRAVWKIGQARFESAPPKWRLSYAGQVIGYDLDLTLDGAAMWFSSPLEQEFMKKGRLSYSVYAKSKGLLRINDELLDVDGYAFHEHATYLNFDMAKTFYRGEGLKWHNGFSDRLKFFAFKEATGRSFGWIIHSGRLIECTYNVIEELKWWDDPRSTMHIPVEWLVHLEGPEISMTVKSRAFVRAYYYWDFMKESYAVLYWYLCKADGVVNINGKIEQIENMKYVVHTNRLI